MHVCTTCLHTDDRSIRHCPSCGDADIARASRDGWLTSLPPDSGIPCQGCFEAGHELKLRYFKHVMAFVFASWSSGVAGYFCPRCRRSLFAKHLALTLVLGWWGIFAFWFRNPIAILVNLWGLFAAPLDPGTYGAISVDEVRAAHRRHRRRDDSYRANPTPSWLSDLSSAEQALVFADVDYYAVLGVESDASPAEIKRAWRAAAMRVHPDRSTDPHSSRLMSQLTDAYTVLKDDRLRRAYDRRHEVRLAA
jgi:hypothetical protein